MGQEVSTALLMTTVAKRAPDPFLIRRSAADSHCQTPTLEGTFFIETLDKAMLTNLLGNCLVFVNQVVHTGCEVCLCAQQEFDSRYSVAGQLPDSQIKSFGRRESSVCDWNFSLEM